MKRINHCRAVQKEAGILQNDDMMKGGPRFRLRYPSAAQPMRTSVYLCPEQAVEMTN